MNLLMINKMQMRMITNIAKKIDQLDVDTTTDHYVNVLKESIKRLEHGIKNKKMKRELHSKYSKYPKLVNLIDLMEITHNQYERADYWISFHYEIKFGDLITLSRQGTGPYDEILVPTLFAVKITDDVSSSNDSSLSNDTSSSDSESVEEYDYEQYCKANARTTEKLYKILDKNVSRKILEEFIEDVFKAI
jgi:hypothetical protein